MRSILYISSFLFLLANSTQAQVVIWDNTQARINIADKVLLLEDPTCELNLDDVKRPETSDRFEASEQVILNFGFTTSCFWIHFKLNNPTDEDIILELAHTHLENVQCYVSDSTGVFSKLKSGYHLPISEKFKKHHFQIFPLAKGNHSYFIKLSKPVQPLPIRIYRASDYEIKSNHQRLVFGFYIGLMLFVIISNLFFYLSLRNKLFLFYSGLVLLYLSYTMFVMGRLRRLFYTQNRSPVLVYTHTQYRGRPTNNIRLIVLGNGQVFQKAHEILLVACVLFYCL